VVINQYYIVVNFNESNERTFDNIKTIL